MSTSSITPFSLHTAVASNIPDSQRATADALFKMVSELEQSAAIKARRVESSRMEYIKDQLDDTADVHNPEARANELSSQIIDGTRSFCEWLTSVRALQKNPCDRKKMVASFAMLVFHSGIEGNSESVAAEGLDLLTKEQLNFVGRAPGWNSNERRILAVLKSHFHTLKRLSGPNKSGISYADMSSLFVSKKKLRERLALTASEKCAKSGMGIGLIFQIVLVVAFLEFGLNISIFFGVIGALIGFYKERNFSGTAINAVKGLLWGLSAGSALGAVVGANQANLQFDGSLAAGVDSLREDLSALCFDTI